MRYAQLFSAETRQTDREVWRLVLPCLLESLLTYAVGLITSAMIGRLTADDISAQGIGFRVANMISAFFRGIGVGATVLVGVHYGAGHLEKCRKLVEQTMLVVFALSVACVLAVLCAPQFFLGFFAEDQGLLDTAENYLRVAIWLCPGAAVSRIVTAAFNGQGDTRTPLYIAVLTNVVNAALGWVLIFGCGPVPAMGLLGAAYSQVISNCFSICVGLFALYRRNGLYARVHRGARLWNFDLADLKSVFVVGLPASVENMMWTFAAMVMSRALLSYGSDVYAGYQLASQCEEVLGAPAFGFQTAATTLSAQCVGRKDRWALRRYFSRSCVLAVAISLPCMLLMIVFPGLFMALLTDKPLLQEVGAEYLIIVALAYIPQMLNMIAFGTVRAMGHKYFPVIGSMTGMWCVRIPIAALAAWVLHADIAVVFAGVAIDQCYRFILAWIFIKRKRLLSAPTVPED